MKEVPMINATMWTQVNLREGSIISRLSELLAKRTDDFMPTIIYGGKLTARKNKKYDKDNEDDVNLFIKCLNDNDVLRIILTNSDRKKREVMFAFTIAFVPQFTAVSLEVTHSFFRSQNEKDRFMDIITKMIEIISPMFVNIDDIGNSLDIMEEAGEDTYQLDKYVPALFWGNYFGEKYISHFGEEKLLNSPFGYVTKVCSGIMITMTNDPMEFDSDKCVEERKKLSKYIGIGKFRLIKKIFGR